MFDFESLSCGHDEGLTFKISKNLRMQVQCTTNGENTFKLTASYKFNSGTAVSYALII